MAKAKPGHSNAWYLDIAPATVSSWLVSLRWIRATIEVAVLLATALNSRDDFPLYRIAPLVAFAMFTNIDRALRLSRGDRDRSFMAAATIAVDMLILTELLELSGGPSNPFSVFYIVLMGLASATLSVRWAYTMGAWAGLCYGVLVYWHLGELVPSHHRLIDFPTHLFTMWMAGVLSAELAFHFVREATLAIGNREAALEELRRQASREERLMSLTTLAAGAAHELSTPLATIAIASSELERTLATNPGSDVCAADARLIRQQVDRCHGILDQMSGRVGGSAADRMESTDIADLFADLRRRLPPDQANRVQVKIERAPTRVFAPRAGLAQVLLSLVKNAFDASDASKSVTLEGVRHEHVVRFIVRDEGHGMPKEVLHRAGEPFYTTKEVGSGSGLGLFLARMFAERCGGTLTLQSDRGTVATLELPLGTDSTGVM